MGFSQPFGAPGANGGIYALTAVGSYPSGATTAPLDVVSYGGLLSVDANVPNGGGLVAILAAPAAGKCWRVHNWGLNQATDWVEINDAGNLKGALAAAGMVYAGGQLFTGAITAQNFGAAAAVVVITYDAVAMPYIQ